MGRRRGASAAPRRGARGWVVLAVVVVLCWCAGVAGRLVGGGSGEDSQHQEQRGLVEGLDEGLGGAGEAGAAAADGGEKGSHRQASDTSGDGAEVVSGGVCPRDPFPLREQRDCSPERARKLTTGIKNRFQEEGFQFSHPIDSLITTMDIMSDALRKVGLPLLPSIPVQHPFTPSQGNAIRVTDGGLVYVRSYTAATLGASADATVAATAVLSAEMDATPAHPAPMLRNKPAKRRAAVAEDGDGAGAEVAVGAGGDVLPFAPLPEGARRAAAGTEPEELPPVWVDGDSADDEGVIAKPDAVRHLTDAWEGALSGAEDGATADAVAAHSEAASAHFHPYHKRNLIIFGKDERSPITATTSFPRRTIGQIDIENRALCSGTVISRDSVLTAAHCVHGGSAGAAFKRLDFSPGRYRDSSGKVVSPYGTWKFDYFTVFQGWVDRTDFGWDMAVITYQRNSRGQRLGDVVGYMGLARACAWPPLRTSGYPGDKPYGTAIVTPVCRKVELRGWCGSQLAMTDCDMFAGQSGSAVYDTNNRVYMTVSFATGAETKLPDTSYPLYMNGLNVMNDLKFPSIYQWAFHKK